ncbi:MAG: hypothetical protein ACXVCP_03010 [Bdellovibrio sp.]
MTLFITATVIQSLAILFDEFYFHRKRGLPKWEIIGHPIDTSLVIACFLFLALAEKNPTNEIIYYILATASCVCVTKDEWVHHKYCSGSEMWLHAVLFMMHPLILFSAVNIWEDNQALFLGLSGGIFVFLLWEILYWNIVTFRARVAKANQQYRQIKQEDLYEYFSE